jgi:5-methylcytosine-specific restriction protein A
MAVETHLLIGWKTKEGGHPNMPRSTEEWIGKNDDTPVPPRVKIRVKLRANSCCEICKVRAERGDTDHITPLIFSTKDEPLNRERNLQWLCINHHKAKTKSDVALKSLVAKRQIRVAGLEKVPAFRKLRQKLHLRYNWKTRRYEKMTDEAQ